WHIAALWIAAGSALALAAGWVLSRFDLDRWVEPFVFNTRTVQLAQSPTRPTLRQRVDASRAETVDVLRGIWLYVVVAIGVGAAIHGWVPEGFFEDYAGGDNPLSVVVATALGVPLYANPAGVVPLAEAFYAKGASLGTVMAFMMSVVALSVPSLVMLRRVLKPPLLAIFTAIVTAGIVLIGILFNLIT
ncbi:MAG: permease, partial [Acidimicrobiia bacterium]